MAFAGVGFRDAAAINNWVASLQPTGDKIDHVAGTVGEISVARFYFSFRRIIITYHKSLLQRLYSTSILIVPG